MVEIAAAPIIISHIISAMSIALVIPLLLGSVSGWLVNYFADVLPFSRRLSSPRCPECSQPYPWRRYLVLRRCPNCGHNRGLRPWLVLAATLAISIYTWIVPNRIGYWPGILLFTYFGLVVVIDLEHRLILHNTSIAGALIGLGIGIYLHGIPAALLGGLAGFGIMLLFYLLGELFVRYMSRRRGETIDEVALGYGDVNLAGIVGLLLGWPAIIFGLLFTILAGGLASLIVIAVMLIRRKYHAFSAIPYGPFLVLSIVLLLLPQ
jgi:prepilin signal peptidase PulO-like enzyme (type II secretory pathway)